MTSIRPVVNGRAWQEHTKMILKKFINTFMTFIQEQHVQLFYKVKSLSFRLVPPIGFVS